MKRVLACFALLAALLALAFPSLALTLKSDPAAASQTTCPYCFLPTPVAVQVLNERGLPQPGMLVVFSAQGGSAIIPDAGNGPYFAISDANGYATPPAPGFVTMTPDAAFSITASAFGASQSFSVTVQGPAPARVIAATDEPVALVGTQYEDAHFWLVVLDENNDIIPNAAVRFDLDDDVRVPSGRFVEGSRTATQPVSFTVSPRRAFVPVSEYGTAFSPLVRANLAPGMGRMRASTLGPQPLSATIAFFNSGRGAASIEPVAGAIPQSTRQAAYFPEHMAVIVRDRAGHPQRDVAVHFSFPNTDASFDAQDGNGYFELSAMTDADGRAVARFPVLALTEPGPLALQVSTPGLSTMSYGLEVLPGPAARLDVISGNDQHVVSGAAFSQPWVVRAMDKDGVPVPYAGVVFTTTNFPDIPGATFGLPVVSGGETAYVMADANGFATAPMAKAVGPAGAGIVNVFGWAEGVYIQLDFEVATP